MMPRILLMAHEHWWNVWTTDPEVFDDIHQASLAPIE
jgi:hypothetical protein